MKRVLVLLLVFNSLLSFAQFVKTIEQGYGQVYYKDENRQSIGIYNAKVVINAPNGNSTIYTGIDGKFFINKLIVKSDNTCLITIYHENFISDYNQKSVNVALDGKFEDIFIQPKEEGIIINLFDNENIPITGSLVYKNHMSSPITISNGYLFHKVDLLQNQKEITFYFRAQFYETEDTTFVYNGFHILNIKLKHSKKKLNDELNSAKTITHVEIEPYIIKPGQTGIFTNADNVKIKNAWHLMDEVVNLEFNTHKEDIDDIQNEIKNSSILSFLYFEAKIIYLIERIENNKSIRNKRDSLFIDCIDSKENKSTNQCNSLKIGFINSIKNEKEFTNQLIQTCDSILSNKLTQTNENYIYDVEALIGSYKNHLNVLNELLEEINKL
jgi:hypothetical protein